MVNAAKSLETPGGDVLRGELDEQVEGVDDPALRVGGEDALGAEVAGVDPGGVLVDEFARLTDELGAAFQDDGAGGAVRLYNIYGDGEGGVVLQVDDLARVGKGANPEGTAVPAVPDGDHMRGAGGICSGEAGDVVGGEEGIDQRLFFRGKVCHGGGSGSDLYYSAEQKMPGRFFQAMKFTQ